MSAETAINEAVGGASERVQGLFTRALKHYLIDPSDPDYGIYRSDGSPLCEVCRCHGQSTKKLACDLEKARAEEMASLGFEAGFCRSCRQAFPKLLQTNEVRPRCAACARLSLLPINGRRPDGAGCVERIHPSERAWDKRPVAGSRGAW